MCKHNFFMKVLKKFHKKVLMKLIQGQSCKKIIKRSECGKSKLTGLQRDHSSTLAITDPASVGVKQI